MRHKLTYQFLVIIYFVFSSIHYSFSQQNTGSSIFKKQIIEAPNDTTKINTYNNWAGSLYIQNLDSAQILWSKMLLLSEKGLKSISSLSKKEKTFYLKNHAEAKGCLAYVHQQKGQIKEAVALYNSSLSSLKKLNDKKSIATTYVNLGLIYEKQGNFKLAWDFYQKALQLKNILNDEKGIANLYNNIGVLLVSQGDLKKGIKYHFKGAAIRNRINDKRGLSQTLINIGSIYLRTDNLDSAKWYFDKGYHIQDSLNDQFGIAVTLNFYGVICDEKSDLNQANDFYQKSLLVSENTGDKEAQCYSLNNLSRNYLRLNQINKSEIYANRSLILAKELGYLQNLLNAYELLFKIYIKQNKYQNAVEMHENYIKIRDSLKKDDLKRAWIEKEYRLEYEKKSAILKAEKEKQKVIALNDKKIANAKLKQRNIIISTVCGGIVMLLVFVFLLYTRWIKTKKQKEKIEIQKSIIEEKASELAARQKEITDSINYAKRIQFSLLAHTELLNSNLNDYFIYFEPKDIVSGDFYYATKKDNYFYLAVCDSTGHGVPGAFMSLLNISFLNEAIIEKNIEAPNQILNYVRNKLIHSMDGAKDGMDAILLKFNLQENNNPIKLEYAAAHNCPLLIRNNQLIELKSNNMPVGKGELVNDFTLFTIDLYKNDLLVCYTDGFADQFGGPKEKKFKYKNLNQLLLKLSIKNLSTIHQELDTTFNNWKGDLEQVDDVCIIGIRV